MKYTQEITGDKKCKYDFIYEPRIFSHRHFKFTIIIELNCNGESYLQLQVSCRFILCITLPLCSYIVSLKTEMKLIQAFNSLIKIVLI